MIRTAAGPEVPALRLFCFRADPLRRIGGGRASQGPRGRNGALAERAPGSRSRALTN